MAKLPSREEMGGMDPEFLTSLMKRIPPNPVTGQTDMSDIVKFMSQHPEELQKLVGQMNEPTTIDYANYDFKALAKTAKPHTVWVVQLEDMGLVDNIGNPVDKNEGERIATARQYSMIYVYDEKGRYRSTQEVYGSVTAEDLTKALQDAIAKPTPPLKPALPSMLIIALAFQKFGPALRPWLDALPPPFTWRFETQEERRTTASGVSNLNEKGFTIHSTRSSQFRQQGNEAFKKKDRTGAVDAYTNAIDELEEALNLADIEGNTDAQAEAKSTLAICYANRAAAWCLEGAGLDARKAIDDGTASEGMNKTYAKAYYRQAKALMILNRKSDAEDVLIRALSLPELENDTSLVDFLIDLQTNGKGLPQDEEGFKQWILDICTDDAKPEGNELKSLKGEWKRRCDVLSDKFAKEKKR